MAPTKAELEAKLAPFGQEHAAKFYDDLSDADKESFAAELLALDLAHMKEQFDRVQAASSGKLDEFMEPLPAEVIGQATPFPPTEEMKGWQGQGIKLMAEGKVAALLLAGGQGTRLGSKDPKGMFPLGLPSGKTLFQLQAERIMRLQTMAKAAHGTDCVIPWYIMTSGPTFGKTKAFFEEQNYFGLDSANVFFFEQFVIPSLTGDGKLILNGKGSLAKNPDGNGGLYRALRERGALADMAKRGVEHVHVYCVDNVLVKVANPTFIGFAAELGADAGALVVPKKDPSEKVGVVCRVEGKYQVVEYSEISQATSEKRGDDGELIYSAGNICNHYFSRAFLELCGKREDELVHHVAHKKIPVLSEDGSKVVTPDEINGIKLEKFVFDVFQFAEKLAVLEVSRHHSFSPLKNKSGAPSCTAETCCADLYRLHRLYLKHAGATFANSAGSELTLEQMGSAEAVEISPLASYAGENLEKAVAKKGGKIASFPVQILPEDTA